MLYRLVTLLSFLLGTVAVAEAQEPVGYWLYVDGAWKGAFVTRADCDAAAAKTTGKLSECRALYLDPVAPREPLRRAGVGPDSSWESAVQRCRSWGLIDHFNFDAFVSGPGRAEMAGTARAKLAFKKCMTEAGQRLE